METHIKAIIEEDLKAQEIYRLAEVKVTENLANIHKEKSKIQDEVWDKAKHFVETEKQKLTNQLTADQTERQKQYQTAFSALEREFNAQQDVWRKQIFEHVLKRGQ